MSEVKAKVLADQLWAPNLFPAPGVESIAEVRVVDPRRDAYDVRRYGVDPTLSDVSDALEEIALKLPYLEFPPGTYRISRTIQRMANSRWVGLVPQSNENGAGDVTPEVVIYGTVANIGDGEPMIRLCEPGIAGSSFVTEYISFQSDLSVDIGNLSAVSGVGVIGVDVSHAKNGTEFIGCAFRNMRSAIQQGDPDPYCDKITLSQCHITRCYLTLDADPTAGISLVDTFIYDCRDFVDSTTDVSAINCSFNNSSNAGDASQITARMIVMVGGWIEGGNNFLNPSKYCKMEGVRTSEMLSSSFKYLIRPQGNNVAIDVSGTRVPTNTRLINFSDVSDEKTISVRAFGLWDGVNFGNTADINFYLDRGLDYYGSGNKNATAWNVINKFRNAQNADYTFTPNDAGRLVYHTSGIAHTWTIPANASVSFPLNSVIHLSNTGAGVVTVAITSDTLRWGASTGSFTLRQHEAITLRKIADTTWQVEGSTSGTYTPTLTNVANVDAATSFSAQYLRVGGVVTVSGKVNVDPTASATLTQLGISLPIPSNFASEQDCAGAGTATSVAESGAINADATNDRAQLNFISAVTANHTIMFQFTYRVLP